MITMLFVQKKANESLDDFVEVLARELSLPTPEQRSSSNYPRETYFLLKTFGMKVSFFEADVMNFEEYSFAMGVTPNYRISNERELIAAVLNLFAHWLVVNGYRVAGSGLRAERSGRYESVFSLAGVDQYDRTIVLQNEMGQDR